MSNLLTNLPHAAPAVALAALTASLAWTVLERLAAGLPWIVWRRMVTIELRIKVRVPHRRRR